MNTPRNIPGWELPNVNIEAELVVIENALGREVTDDEIQEIAVLWDHNYDSTDIVEMLRMGLTASQYEDRFDNFDYEE